MASAPPNSAAPVDDEIVDLAMDLARDEYLEAIAGELIGQPIDSAWQRVEWVLARAMMLAELEGMAGVFDTVRGEADGELDDLSDDPVFPDGSNPVEMFQRTTFDVNGIEVALDDVSGPFVAKAYLEAIQSFDARIPRLAIEARAMITRVRAIARAIAVAEQQTAVEELAAQSNAIREALSRTFFASDVDLETVIDLRDLVSEAIRGASLPSESIALPEFISRANLTGARNLTSARFETIYRTNINRAYSDGQSEALRRPVVRQFLPLVMFDAIGDSRTRPTHDAMDGYINTQAEFDRLSLVPPIGYNCRCSRRGVSYDEARNAGWIDENGNPDPVAITAHNGARQQMVDVGLVPDPGWA